jgi:predicted Zn-dependent protease
MPLHLNMEIGDTPVEDMIKDMDRGLYITRFNYTREVHPREVVITGLTRDGTFLIENGEITTPVHNLRFTQSYIKALQNVISVGNRADTSRGYFGVRRTPALCLSSFRFTGTTQF